MDKTKKPKKKKQSNSRSARCGRAGDAIRLLAEELNTAGTEAERLASTIPEDGDTVTLDEESFNKIPGDAEGPSSELEELKDELQSWFDNLPESLQGGDTGTRLEEAIGNLESAVDSLSDVDWPEAPSGEVEAADLNAFAEKARDAAQALEDAADEAEGTEFPGMYGK